MSDKPKDFIPPEEYYAQLPKKRMAALVVYTNAQGEILIVKPSYRKEWLLPGGVIENDESPYLAAKRETNEEIGLDIVSEKLLVVNYVRPAEYKTEAIHFVFYGGELSEDDIKNISLNTEELETYEFATFEAAIEKTSPAVSQMLKIAQKSVEDGQTRYMEGTTRV